MNWLWLLLLVPVGLFFLGALVYSIGGELPIEGGKPRELAVGCLLNTTAMGCFSTLLLAVVFGPTLLLYRVAHLPYGVSAWVGLPLGFGILIGLVAILMAKAPQVKESEQTPEPEPVDEPEQTPEAAPAEETE